MMRIAAAMLLLIACGCDDMRRDGRIKPYEPTGVPGAMSVPAQLSGTRARGQFSQDLPPKVDRELLLRGQLQFAVYCSLCHGADGQGRGIVVRRGFTPPPSLHISRLRAAPQQHFYDVITNGRGAMYSYAGRVPPRDRWAIAAYIRVLQFSQYAPLDKLPPPWREQLESEGSR